MYYVLTCPPLTNDKGELQIETHNYDSVGDVWEWGCGDVFDDDEIQSIPAVINYTAEPFHGYQGPPVEIRDNGVCVMSKRLADAFIGAGVDNIDFYPVIITNTVSGETYDFMAYNIVGKIAAADMDKSEFFSYDDKHVADVSFSNLVLDESNTHGLPVFRLAEQLSAILVHESVYQHIIDQGIDTLTFLKPEEYLQL